jgi:hypothetical protein
MKTGSSLGFLFLLSILGGYFYLKANAREIIIDYANEKCDNLYKVDLHHVQLNLFDRNLKIKNFTFTEIQHDTSTSNIEYIQIPEIEVQISSLSDILEESPNEKYFLSQKTAERILKEFQ